MSNELKPVLSSEECAEMIGILPRSLIAYRRRGYGPPYIRTGHRTIVYLRDDIVKWMNERREVPPNPGLPG